MRLEHLQFDNFLRLNLFDLNLTDATVHLIAGKNEAGKTSVSEAIRFALLGETVRIDKKSDYRLMIRDGAKSGTVGVNIDGVDIIRDIKSGKETTDERTVQLPLYLPYLINAQQFAKQKHEVRRSFLIGLTGTKVSGDDISRRMRAKGVADSCIEMILPMLRSGFTATHKEALNRASEHRQQWVGLTGNQRYGSQIAVSWKPELPENFDHKAFLDGEKDLEQLKTSIDQLNIKKGGVTANMANAEAALSENKEPVVFKQADLTKINTKIKKAEEALSAQEAKHKDMNDRFFNAKEKSPVTCCECGALLKVEFTSEHGKGRVSHCEPYEPMSESDMNKLQSEIFDIAAKISKAKNVINELRTEAGKLEADKLAEKSAKASTTTQGDVDKLEADLGDINDKLSKLDDQYGDLNETVTSMRIIAEKIIDAGKIESRAQDLHKLVQDWEKCVETLAPDGIPAEILSDALKPVNDRLRNTANITDWPQVTIDPTMEIIVEGRRYSLLSESAQWRADVAITDAIAHLSGLGMMIIDRMDVLDIGGRANFMKWINQVMPEYESILIFATLKQLPTLPKGMKAHWISNGECSTKEKHNA